MSTSVVKLHARKSPSGSARWTICHASVAREKAVDNGTRGSNAAADRGTVIHDLGEGGLVKGDSYIEDRRVKTRAKVEQDGTVLYASVDSKFLPEAPVVDEEMCDAAVRYVDFVRDLSLGGDLFVEQRLSIEHITGEKDAKGTSDTVICFPEELVIVDLKGGWMRVMASYPFEHELFEYGPDEMKSRHLFPDSKVMFPNTQLLMYADAVREQYEAFYDFKTVRLIVVQPMLDHIDQHVMDMEEFAIWVQWVREQSQAAELPDARVVPSASTCQWCKVFPCKEAEAFAIETAISDFDDEDIAAPTGLPTDPYDLGRLKRLTPFVRMWADAIDSRVLAELQSGREVSGWKLVDGDMGDRKWTDENMPAVLAGLGLTEEQYLSRKTVGPAKIEALVRRSARSANRPLSKEQWDTLQQYITRSDGVPKVAPDSDPRSAVSINPADDFDII